MFGRYVDEYRLATPVFRQQPAIRQLFLDPLRQRAGLIDFINRHNDGDFGGMGVIDRFNRLRHDAVVGRRH